MMNNALMGLFNTWVSMVDFPAVILLVMTVMGAYVMYRTQKNQSNNFDFADMLRDDSGKPSAFRLAIFPCLGVSSWVIMYIVVQTKTIDLWLIVLYMLIWSGAKIADKLVDAYVASKGGVPVPTPVGAQSMGTITGAAGLVLPTRAVTK
jgi:hypothetical protein